MRSSNSSAPVYPSPMEKEQFWGLPWGSTISPELNSGSGAGINQYWDHHQRPMGQEQQFESALSSLVSSPSSNPATAPADSVVIGELIGRLGSICNSGDMSPSSRYHSANNSCYSTPLNSPPKIGGMSLPLNPMQLSPISADPGFVERAVKFSTFSGRNYGGFSGQFGLPETGKLSRVSSSQSLKGAQMAENGKELPMFDPAQLGIEMKGKYGGRISGASTPDEPMEFGNLAEVSSVANRIPAVGGESNGRKRKGGPKGKGKEAALSSAANIAKVAEEGNSDLKRSKPIEANGGETNAAVKPKAEQNGEFTEKNGKDNNTKPPEPPKDYIHVRARRGQATDSHSLAERVRREKISERMKFLQDLVPGCNKVTGKAVMLDEIINYVQSLQRQVEFLSMKLTTVNPRLDHYVENMLPKDNHQASMSMPHQPLYPLETTSSAFQYPQPQGTPGLLPHNSLNQLESTLHRGLNGQPPTLDGFGDAGSQLGNFWEDDLQSVVQMGLGQGQENAFSSQVFHGN